MNIPNNIIVNADDFGLRASVNKAILHCFEQGYINSTSLITNQFFFEAAADMFHANPVIHNVGVHVNLSEGRPLTNFNQKLYLDENGNWNNSKVSKKYSLLNNEAKSAFSKEIYAQINKAISSKIPIVHLDSHYHTHTLPGFYKLFLDAAKSYKLKIRIAQTYNENNYLKFYYRKYINGIFKANRNNYSDLFENLTQVLRRSHLLNNEQVTEIMVHPDFDQSGILFDHYDAGNLKEKGAKTIKDWICFLNN